MDETADRKWICDENLIQYGLENNLDNSDVFPKTHRPLYSEVSANQAILRVRAEISFRLGAQAPNATLFRDSVTLCGGRWEIPTSHVSEAGFPAAERDSDSMAWALRNSQQATE